MKILNVVDLYVRDKFNKDIIRTIPANDEKKFIIYGLTYDNDEDTGGYSVEIIFKRFNDNDNPEIMLINSLGKTLNIINSSMDNDRGDAIPEINANNTLAKTVMMFITKLVNFKRAANNIPDVLLYAIVNKDNITSGGKYINPDDNILSIVCSDFKDSNKIMDAS